MKLPLAAALVLIPLFAQAAGGGGGHLATTRTGQLHEGYAILYDLAEKEKNANLIFVMKTGEPWTKETTKEIADLYAKIDHDLSAWASDDSFDLQATHLPAIETDTRSALNSAHTHDLFATKGDPFDHLFLTLQWQSLFYGTYLLENLQKDETNPSRLKALAGYEREMRRLLERVSEKI